MAKEFHTVETKEIKNQDGSVTTVTTVRSGSAGYEQTVINGQTVVSTTVTTSQTVTTRTENKKDGSGV